MNKVRATTKGATESIHRNSLYFQRHSPNYLASKYTIAIALSSVIPGLGQLYLGRTKRGILFLVVGIALALTAIYFSGPLVLIAVCLLYWVWNAHDAHQSGKRLFLAENPRFRNECPECSGTGKVRIATTAASMYSPFFASKCPCCNGVGLSDK